MSSRPAIAPLLDDCRCWMLMSQQVSWYHTRENKHKSQTPKGYFVALNISDDIHSVVIGFQNINSVCASRVWLEPFRNNIHYIFWPQQNEEHAYLFVDKMSHWELRCLVDACYERLQSKLVTESVCANKSSARLWIISFTSPKSHRNPTSILNLFHLVYSDAMA